MRFILSDLNDFIKLKLILILKHIDNDKDTRP